MERELQSTILDRPKKSTETLNWWHPPCRVYKYICLIRLISYQYSLIESSFWFREWDRRNLILYNNALPRNKNKHYVFTECTCTRRTVKNVEKVLKHDLHVQVCIQVNVQYDGKFNICRKDVLLKNVRLLILLCFYLLGRWNWDKN